MNMVDYDKATFSLAIIDFDLFIECLQNLDNHLKDARENMCLIFREDNTELIPFIEQYSLRKFETAKNYFKTVKKSIIKYTNKLQIFLSKNPKSKETFDTKVKTLNELIEEKEIVIDEEIAKCQDYIARNLKLEDTVD